MALFLCALKRKGSEVCRHRVVAYDDIVNRRVTAGRNEIAGETEGGAACSRTNCSKITKEAFSHRETNETNDGIPGTSLGLVVPGILCLLYINENAIPARED